MEDNSQNNNGNENIPAPEEKITPSENKEVEDFKLQLQKSHNDMLYLKADFENYKKRIIKEQSDIRKYGSEHLIRSMLDLLDNFERALSFEIKPENIKSFMDGIQMVQTEFKNVLQRYGVSEIEAVGKPFDPTVHEAMGTEPTKDVPAGHVSKVFTKPYKLHDRVIRPGRVIIAQEQKPTE